METIFDIQSFDRDKVHWEDYLFVPTPIEEVKGIRFKREDKFAPLGYGNINGSKMRQCLWLVDSWVKDKNINGVVSGSVVGSPQHPFISAICKHYGIESLIATPAKDVKTHSNLAMAEEFGATFHKTKIGYARALQSISFKLAKELDNYEVLETNITVDEKLNPPQRIEAFHKIGSRQTENIPDDIETLLIPVGSANSVVSVLYGLAMNMPKSLKTIVMFGIGNNGSYNLQYIPHRLETIGRVINRNINSNFDFSTFSDSADILSFLEEKNDGVKVELFNLNAMGYCEYSDMMPYRWGNIDFHPRYEGKIMNWIEENPEEMKPYWNDKSLFWIVGNEPKL